MIAAMVKTSTIFWGIVLGLNAVIVGSFFYDNCVSLMYKVTGS